MENTVTLKYTVNHGQLCWSGRTNKHPFAGVMANTPEELMEFGRDEFPGLAVKLEEA